MIERKEIRETREKDRTVGKEEERDESGISEKKSEEED